ncbi:hypothetical protein J2T09_003025 [Neorhizobium huautlense]|uniref:Knr4/Smi1-like domain-containing protein n=1 Tax=Neorhizobium huautlense TaxID=67774 RepID=A0ABT9PUW6_9HYPH|nr:SMI1/KNR4 family protein [Neorhizobium huautlense]MDP9838258.1 hypothetical protein [Neorhizobium huautlense]
MEISISPVEDDWRTDGIAELVSGWERESGLVLPAGYRTFLIGFNGGRPYPNMFRHTALLPEDGCGNPTEHFLDCLYSVDRVMSWSKELGDRLPAGCLAIGGDPGLLEIILSLRPEDYGDTYSWVRSWASWGSPDNSYLCPQASSFSAWLGMLFDDDERSGHDHWHTPRAERLKRSLEIA